MIYSPLREKRCGKCQRFILSATRPKLGTCERYGKLKAKTEPPQCRCFVQVKTKGIMVHGRKISGKTVESIIEAMEKMECISIQVIASFVQAFEELPATDLDLAYKAAYNIIRQQLKLRTIESVTDGFRWKG